MKYPDEALIHYGVPGMRWGRRKMQKRAQKRAQKKAKRDAARNKVIDRINNNPNDALKLFAAYNVVGEKGTRRILDLMGKDPTRSLDSAIDRQAGEQLAKSMLITFGAVAVGGALAAID